MKFLKIISLGIVLILVSSTTKAQEDVIVKMALSGRPDQTTIIPLEFGLKQNATNGLDKELGEKQIPPFFPPSGLEGRLTFMDSTNYRFYSYKDFRPFENSEKFTIEYKLVLQAAAQRRDPDPKLDYLNVYFMWDKLSPYIDSARLHDAFDIINVDMKDINQYILTNEFIDDLFITVHFNLAGTGIEEFPEALAQSGLQVYPNPAQTELFIAHKGKDFQYRIFSVTGNTMLSGSAGELAKIDVSTLPAGVYAITITDENSTNVRQFIKQ